MRIIAIPEVEQYLESLKQILFEKEYFSFEEDAQEYVDDLFFDIKTNLPLKHHKPAKPHFDQFGKGIYYASFKMNRNTTWYAFSTNILITAKLFTL